MNTMGNLASDGDIYVQNYIVLFADILNQQEAISSLEKLPGNEEEYKKYVKALKASAGKVMGLRRCIDTFISSHGVHSRLNVDGLSIEQREAYRVVREPNIRVQRFADTVIAYASLGNRYGYARMGSTLGIICGAATFLLTSFAAETAIRGGIDLKPAIELSSGDLYGPAFVGAYRLEHSVADWPRVVVGDAVVTYLDCTIRDERQDPIARVSRALATSCRALMQQDEQGVWFVDFLGKGVREFLDAVADKELVSAVFKGYDWVKVQGEHFSRRSEECRQQDDAEAKEVRRLMRRYQTLRGYYERRVPQWLQRYRP